MRVANQTREFFMEAFMKKHLKKMAVLVAAFIAVAAFVACDRQQAGANGKIRLIGMGWGATENNERMTARLFAEFPELAEKYEVEWVIGGGSNGEVGERIRLALAANE